MSPEISYANWPIVEEATTDGWKFGTCMNYAGEKWGDAFVEAPDGSRAGLVWTMSDKPTEQIVAPDAERWGVYKVSCSSPMNGVSDLVKNFRKVLPDLQKLHESARVNMQFDTDDQGRRST